MENAEVNRTLDKIEANYKTSFKQFFKEKVSDTLNRNEVNLNVDQDGSGLVSREEFRKFLLK